MTTPITFESGLTYTVNLLDETIDELGTIQPKLVPLTIDGYLIDNVQYASVLPSDDPQPPNKDPYFTDVVNSGDYPTFQENITGGSIIALYSASDDDGDNLTFSITGGADQSYFEIETIQK